MTDFQIGDEVEITADCGLKGERAIISQIGNNPYKSYTIGLSRLAFGTIWAMPSMIKLIEVPCLTCSKTISKDKLVCLSCLQDLY